MRRALIAVVEEFRAYRTYATGEERFARCAGAYFAAAVAAAKAVAVPVDAVAIDYLAQVIAAEGYPPSPARERAVRLFNQLTAPVAAKAVEDTAFYRYGRLLSRNDVGFDAEDFAISPAAFHARMTARMQATPQALLATATHDHKRGEDARARLAVLSEMPEDWAATVAGWFRLNAPLRDPLLDAGDEYQLYQTLVGAWPLSLRAADREGLSRFAERICGWREKSLREAKLRTSWADPDTAFEAANREFVRALLDPGQSAAFLQDLAAFVTKIAPAGALNGLVQTVLRCTAPGIPDLYQGAEGWDFSLVDPDNRRPVDYARLRTALGEEGDLPASLAAWRSGTVKQAVIARLLALRAQMPALFAQGDYAALDVHGTEAGRTLAFIRQAGGRTLLVAVPLRCGPACIAAGMPLPGPEFWGDTEIVAGGEWHNLLTGGRQNTLRCAELFTAFPAAVLTAG